MRPTGALRDGAVHVGGDARQRFYDSRGYGRPLAGNEIALSRIEAAHLLFRGDLSDVALDHGDGPRVGFERFFVASAAATDRFAIRYLVYADLRDRGFYLSPARDGWPGGEAAVAEAVDLVVYERGATPDTGNVSYPVRVVGERETVSASDVVGQTLAVVDEESDITYFAATIPELAGTTAYDPPTGLPGVLLDDRVVIWNAPDGLYERGFYGQPLTGRAANVEDVVQLSLIEAASLAGRGLLSLSRSVDGVDPGSDPGIADAERAIRSRGRTVEGDRFDRRLTVYDRLRERSIVPKTGFKFGADFRTYLDVETVEELPHSTHLVRVVEPDHAFVPRELSLDVRLAGGVRKEMVFAMPDDEDIDWLSVSRLTP